MEHNPFTDLDDETTVTYSDIKTDDNNQEYITIYFETPVEWGFKSMQVNYPGGAPEKVKGYTLSELAMLMHYYSETAAAIFERAIEDNHTNLDY